MGALVAGAALFGVAAIVAMTHGNSCLPELLPYLLVVACPLLHLLAHRGHDGGGHAA